MTAASYLLIGGGGFVGRHIIDQLLARNDGAKLTVFDLRKTFDDPRVAFVVGDLTRPADLLAATRGVDVVFHAASPHPGTPASIMFKVNVEGTKNVIDACVTNGVKKLVFTSSSGVIFNGQNLIGADETVPYCRVHMDAYNESKAKAEQLVLTAAGRGGLLTIALRPASIFGARDAQGGSTLVRTAKQGRTGVQIGTNEFLFDWTYVENVAHAHILAADKLTEDNGTNGEAFIITNDNPVFFWDFTKRIWAEYGRKDTLKFAMPRTLALLIAFIFETIAFILSPLVKISPVFTVYRVRLITSHRYFNISKAKSVLGYKPIVSLDEGIRRTVKYYIDHPEEL
ncbi:3-beta hydroxysteroid dehydrogenase/isomerase family-domain-containing protein [Zopfochytrium polystomum]|nr:3-beta hydroxysteroid dehydrogenase/isomerase family-domain-containing protein [Zopfochytrium polystomum]